MPLGGGCRQISLSLGTAEAVTQRNSISEKKKANLGSGEMAQWLRTLVTFAEDPGSIPSIHMVALTRVSLGMGHTYGTHAFM